MATVTGRAPSMPCDASCRKGSVLRPVPSSIWLSKNARTSAALFSHDRSCDSSSVSIKVPGTRIEASHGAVSVTQSRGMAGLSPRARVISCTSPRRRRTSSTSAVKVISSTCVRASVDVHLAATMRRTASKPILASNVAGYICVFSVLLRSIVRSAKLRFIRQVANSPVRLG